MRQARIRIAKPDIFRFFEQYPTNIFARLDISRILAENRTFWRLAQATNASEFISFLKKEGKLKEYVFDFKNLPLRKSLFIWGDASVFKIFSSIQRDGYFSHYSAIYIHGLTEQVPKTFYVNKEQSPKLSLQKELTQEEIDSAFGRPARQSNSYAWVGEYRVYLLSGKHAGNVGVIEATAPDGSLVRVTDIERTLIDCTVRPEYSGGVFEVLKAYRNAHEKISVNRLAAILKKLEYRYPYHQAVGFYLEKAGVYDQEVIRLFGKIKPRYDFYLVHKIAEKEYSSRWRLYFPKGL